MSQNHASGIMLWAVPRFHRAETAQPASEASDATATQVNALRDALDPALVEPPLSQVSSATR